MEAFIFLYFTGSIIVFAVIAVLNKLIIEEEEEIGPSDALLGIMLSWVTIVVVGYMTLDQAVNDYMNKEK